MRGSDVVSPSCWCARERSVMARRACLIDGVQRLMDRPVDSLDVSRFGVRGQQARGNLVVAVIAHALPSVALVEAVVERPKRRKDLPPLAHDLEAAAQQRARIASAAERRIRSNTRDSAAREPLRAED